MLRDPGRRWIITLALLVAVACAPVETPPDPPPTTDDDDDSVAEGSWLFEADDRFEPSDDDDVLDDDDVVVVEPPTPGPCPDPDQPLPETPFAAVSDCVGITSFSAARDGKEVTGQSWADFDGDGIIDLFTAGFGQGNHLYRNRGDGLFDGWDYTELVAMVDEPSSGATFADYDSDGDPDLLVLAVGGNRLFRNDGGGVYTDVTEGSGLDDVGYGVHAAWADYDEDGLLDVYVSNYLCEECPWIDSFSDSARDRLFWNKGDDTFVDVSELLGEELLNGAALSASWLDWDDDGDLDLYATNDRGNSEEVGPDDLMNRNLLFRNDGPGCGGWCFTEIGRDVGADARMDSMGLAVGDCDNDGDLDLFLPGTNEVRLLRNDDGWFIDVTLAAGLGTLPVQIPWGGVFVDADNDGDQDLYFADGSETIQFPNWLMENQGDCTFVDVSAGSGAEVSGNSAGVTTVDYDGDGWMDLMSGNRLGIYELYRNLRGQQGATGGWLRIRLDGGSAAINRQAVGARVWVIDDDGITRMAEVKLGSSVGGSNDLALHFGLGDAEAEHVTVRWPDGLVTEHADPPHRQEWLLTHP